eukprot:14392008-Alexandrium_andersonii.AAC.1
MPLRQKGTNSTPERPLGRPLGSPRASRRASSPPPAPVPPRQRGTRSVPKWPWAGPGCCQAGLSATWCAPPPCPSDRGAAP